MYSTPSPLILSVPFSSNILLTLFVPLSSFFTIFQESIEMEESMRMLRVWAPLLVIHTFQQASTTWRFNRIPYKHSSLCAKCSQAWANDRHFTFKLWQLLGCTVLFIAQLYFMLFCKLYVSIIRSFIHWDICFFFFCPLFSTIYLSVQILNLQFCILSLLYMTCLLCCTDTFYSHKIPFVKCGHYFLRDGNTIQLLLCLDVKVPPYFSSW